MRAVEALQKSVWGSDDLDVVPVTLLVASREVGAVLIGAYDESNLVGFVYGFPGYENGNAVHHSHMLAVAAEYRNLNIGYKLKLAQRERVLTQGLKRVTWTFDPLQSLNAYFNFEKLGVIADRYKVNFYGETTSSFLLQNGTDRLWVTWLLESEHVKRRLQNAERQTIASEDCVTLLESRFDGAPQVNYSGILDRECLIIEIPIDISGLQHEQPEKARSWRALTRQIFPEAIAAGYIVDEFVRSRRKGMYILRQPP